MRDRVSRWKRDSYRKAKIVLLAFMVKKGFISYCFIILLSWVHEKERQDIIVSRWKRDCCRKAKIFLLVLKLSLEKAMFLVFRVLLFPSSWVYKKERQNNKVGVGSLRESYQKAVMFLLAFRPYKASRHSLLKCCCFYFLVWLKSKTCLIKVWQI